MLYFLLAIIVFIAQLFPEPRAKPLGQQEDGPEKRSRGAGKIRHGNAKSSTPEPISCKAAAAETPSSSLDPLGSARALGYKDPGIGKRAVDVPTQTQVYVVSSGNVTESSEPDEDVGVIMVNISTQTGHLAALEGQRYHTSSSKTSSHIRGAGLVNNDSSDTLASERSPSNCQNEMEEKTSEDGFADSTPSSNPASEATLPDNPSGSLSQSMMQQGPSKKSCALINALPGGEQEMSKSEYHLYRKENSGHSLSFEKTGAPIEEVGETISAVDSSAVVQEQLLVTEKAAHRQTREELARLEDWCKHLESENTELQTRAEDAERENARIQRQLVTVEDESMGYRTEVSNAERQIRNLMTSNEMYVSTIEGLRRQEVDLNGEIAWYLQLGIDFYGRLQEAEQFLNPYDAVFACYQRLISDAALYFSVPTAAGDGNDEVHDHAVRVEEIDDKGHSEGGEDDQESGGFPILDASNISRDHMPTNEADTGEAEAHVAAIDDDEVPCADRPMRPGTANRVPCSVFAVNNERIQWPIIWGFCSASPSISNLRIFGYLQFFERFSKA